MGRGMEKKKKELFVSTRRIFLIANERVDQPMFFSRFHPRHVDIFREKDSRVVSSRITALNVPAKKRVL